MKLIIKKSDGSSVEVDGTQEECLAALQATLGFPPVQLAPFVPNPVVQPPFVQPLPFIPGTLPYTPGAPTGIPWTPGQTWPWQPGTIIFGAGPNMNSTGEYFRVGPDATTLEPISQGAALEALGYSWMVTNNGSQSGLPLPSGFDGGGYDANGMPVEPCRPAFLTGLQRVDATQ
jgi:hypothetical protein